MKLGDKVKIVNYDGVCTIVNISGNQITAIGDNIRFICDVDCVEEVISAPTTTGYDFEILLDKQAALMELAKNKANVSVVPVMDVITWLMAEAGEALNEAKFFKYCRRVEVDRNKLLEELTDCVFMFLELAHITGYHECDYVKQWQCQNGGVGVYDEVTDIHMEFAYLMTDLSWAIRKCKLDKMNECCVKLYNAFETFAGILAYYNFTQDDIVTMYNKKYEVNVQRLTSM